MNKIETTNIYVAKSKHAEGYGVFAGKDFRPRQLIETCPAIFLPMNEFEMIKQTKLYFYFYEYSNKEFAVVLGYGSLYNHSFSPNAQFRFNYSRRVMTVRAIRPIMQGEEIAINYNLYADDLTPLESWFEKGVDANHLPVKSR